MVSEKQRIKGIIEAKKKMNHSQYLASGGEPFENDQMFAIANHKGQKISLVGDVPTLAYYYRNKGNHKGYDAVMKHKSKNWRVIADGAIVGKTNNYDKAEKLYSTITDHPESVVYNDTSWANHIKSYNPRNPKRTSKYDN